MLNQSVIEKARNDPAFGNEYWLTFYLAGHPDEHALILPGLVALNAVNLSGAESGFIYAKVPVSLNEAKIEDRILQMRNLVSNTKVEIVVIDLDASAEVERSKFYTLWQEPPLKT